MQYSFTLLSALLLPALAAAQSANSTTRANSTTAPSVTALPTFGNGTYSNSTRSSSSTATGRNVTNIVTATASDGSLSTATSVVIVDPTADPTRDPTPSVSTTAGLADDGSGAVKRVGDSAGAFAIALGVMFIGHIL